ncbi:MAG: aromatic-ring-hydroxylating dioxygenase subunit beta [Vulcanimicrobiaceae bacterium]
MSRSLGGETHRSLSDFLYRICLSLDARNFKDWIDVCAEGFTYSISAWSPEIRKDVVFLDLDLDGLTTLVKHLPRHNTDQSAFTRHMNVYVIEAQTEEGLYSAISSVVIYRTELDGGTTRPFALGRYHDKVRATPEGWRFVAREVRLETRNLGIGTHYPL